MSSRQYSASLARNAAEVLSSRFCIAGAVPTGPTKVPKAPRKGNAVHFVEMPRPKQCGRKRPRRRVKFVCSPQKRFRFTMGTVGTKTAVAGLVDALELSLRM